jgi:hypothetical protein
MKPAILVVTALVALVSEAKAQTCTVTRASVVVTNQVVRVSADSSYHVYVTRDSTLTACKLAVRTDTIWITLPKPPPDTVYLPAPSVLKAIGSAACVGQICTLDGRASTGATGWLWRRLGSPGQILGTSSLLTITENPGSYTPWLIVNNATARDSVNVSYTSVASPPPPPPPPGPVTGCTGGPKEPAGYTAIIGRHFNSLGLRSAWVGSPPCRSGGSEGWDDAETRYLQNTKLATDSTAPISPPNIVRLLYPAQTVAAGTSFSPTVITTFEFWDPAHYGTAIRYKKLYFRIAFKVSANWQGHSTSTNKLFFIRGGRDPDRFEPIFRLRGVGSGPLILNVGPQGMSSLDKRKQPGICFDCQSFMPNQGVAEARDVPRGRWHLLEGVLEIGTKGAQNGTLRLWLNGALTHLFTDVEYENSATISQFWNQFHIAPVWGGIAGTINALMTLEFDDVYMSGAP